MRVSIDHTVVSGTFSLDGETFDVDNNVWVIGDADECVIIDAPHAVDPILELVGTRKVLGILATHAHDDHVRIAPALSEATSAPVWLHPDDLPIWELTHPGQRPDEALHDGMVIRVGGIDLAVLHTPGHAPGSCCFYAADLGVVFSGDTLFQGGPGATGRSFSDHDTIIASIRERLLTLPAETVVHTGHGPSTTIGAEASALAAAESGRR